MNDFQKRFNNGEVIKFDKPTIVLASASPRRSGLLDSAGIEYVKVLSGVDDSEFNNDFPHENVSRRQTRKYATTIATAKLAPFYNRIINGGVVTADTTVLCNGRILEKPITPEKCREQHEFLSGKTTLVHTAIAVYYNGKTANKVLTAKFKINPIPKHIIDKICTEEETLDSAGFNRLGAINPYCTYDIKKDDIIAGFNVPCMKKLLKKIGFK